MKTLLLASDGRFVTEHASEILGVNLAKKKIAYIVTASKKVDDLTYLIERKDRFQELGWDYEEMDIAGKHPDELREMLKDKDVVYVEGGNSFYLLKCINESGFRNVINELLENGVIYIGTSAGSYVACSTIEMALWKHQDKYDHCGMTDLTAMHFVPFLVTAHYKPEYNEILEKQISEAKYSVRILKDGQAILVRGDEVKFVGEGDEVIV